MVTLPKMTQQELEAYLENAVQTLADELERANGWSSERSRAASLESFNAILRDRVVDSPNQFLRTIVADGEKVGVLWFGVRAENEAVVWDILVHPLHRHKGHGRAAMKAMEAELRTMKVHSVVLNVFAHNLTALKMYSSLGYTPVATKMRKQLR